jgi:hypothetical protein
MSDNSLSVGKMVVPVIYDRTVIYRERREREKRKEREREWEQRSSTLMDHCVWRLIRE